jgi:hypothetical protein
MSFSFSLRSLCALALLAGIFAIPVSHPAAAGGTSTGCLPGVLRQRLAQIRAKFGRVSVISTHRPGARIAGSGRRSFHASCRAVDFHPPRGKYRAVVAWLKSRHGGGVGTYSCGMHHVHIDNGPQIRFHHCVTARGRPIRGRSYASRSRSRRHASRGRSRARYSARRTSRHARRTAHTRRQSRQSRRSAHAGFTSDRFLTRLKRNGA